MIIFDEGCTKSLETVECFINNAFWKRMFEEINVLYKTYINVCCFILPCAGRKRRIKKLKLLKD